MFRNCLCSFCIIVILFQVINTPSPFTLKVTKIRVVKNGHRVVWSRGRRMTSHHHGADRVLSLQTQTGTESIIWHLHLHLPRYPWSIHRRDNPLLTRPLPDLLTHQLGHPLRSNISKELHMYLPITWKVQPTCLIISCD